MKRLLGSLILAVVAASHTRADIISNPVSDGAIAVDTSRSDWAGLTAYTADPIDATAGDVDFNVIIMAHDSTNLYIRYTTHGGPGYSSAWRYNIFIDLDQDRTTGYIGGGSQFSIGADLLIQGASAFSFAGGTNQTSFSWNIEVAGLYNELVNDYELAFLQADLSVGSQFDWIAFGDNFPNTDDYVPDGGNGGSGGTFHTYVIPEPGTALLFAAGLGLLGLVRRSRIA